MKERIVVVLVEVRTKLPTSQLKLEVAGALDNLESKIHVEQVQANVIQSSVLK